MKKQVTKAQGAVVKTINSKEYKFALSMYGLALLEEKLGTVNIREFNAAMRSGSFRTISDTLLVLLYEGGKEYTREVFKEWPADIQFMTDIITETFKEAGFYKEVEASEGAEEDETGK